MNKQEFLTQLRKGLAGLPKEDIDERLTFYSEMIDDRVEDGIPEETAVCEIGPLDELVAQTVADIPLGKLVREKIRPKRKRRAGEIVLIALGSPLWVSLLIAACAVILAVYAAVWSVILALWAVFASLAACGLAGTVGGVVLAVSEQGLTGIAVIGAGMACAGLSVFVFYGCKAAVKGILLLTKKPAIRIKHCFVGKEEVQ